MFVVVVLYFKLSQPFFVATIVDDIGHYKFYDNVLSFVWLEQVVDSKFGYA